MLQQALQLILEIKKEHPESAALYGAANAAEKMLLREEATENDTVVRMQKAIRVFNGTTLLDIKLAQDAAIIYQRILDAYLARAIGNCPACGAVVYSHEKAIWTCPKDLSPSNPRWEGSPVTNEMRIRHDDASLCPSAHGLDQGHCETHHHLPLHEACYENGEY